METQCFISIRFVNGDFQEFNESESFLAKLIGLQKEGLEGKELVHELLSDDWGAPPLFVDIVGATTTGESVKLRIPYE